MKTIHAAAILFSILLPESSWALNTDENKALTDSIPSDEMIVYESSSKLHHITVFTDIDCGYCRKLHSEVPTLNASGVDVRYVAYPRAGLGSDSYKKFVSVYCSENPKKALTQAKMGFKMELADCTNPVEKNYKLGNRLGVKGTPMIVVDDGKVIGGYLTARKLLRRMEVAYKAPPKGSEMFPKVAASRISPQQLYLVVNETHLYTRPDTHMQSMGTMEPDVIQKFSMEIEVDGERWVGFRKGSSQYYTQAKNLQLIPSVATTPMKSKKYMAIRSTALYLSPDRSAKKISDMTANSYYRFNLEVTNENGHWLGFSRSGIKYYVPAADLKEI